MSRGAIAARAGQIIKPAVRAAGFELVRRHFYSPLPDVSALPETLWRQPAEVLAVDLRVDTAVKFMGQDLLPYLAEFRPPRHQQQAGEFYLDNASYGSVDAEILYAMVRHAKPKLVYELGSGASSHVIAAAARRNALDHCPLEHQIVDPYPFTASLLGVVPAAVHAIRVEDIDASEMHRLGPGDILFVDTTHTVKTGGDVTRIFLDLLPRLAGGTWIHIHDIFLPYEYPRRWVVENRHAWAEQYLLQAFLAFNDAFEVVFPAYAVARAVPKALTEAIASFGPAVEPGAFWMRRR